jgi:thiol peroxidase
MAQVRKGATAMRGNPVDVTGEELKVGQKAPDFELVANDLSSVKLSDTTGKVRIVSTVPSLDTGVCDAETRHWDQEVANLGDVQMLTVSVDLPFAQKRWCGAAGVTHQTLSAYSDEKFGEDWGVMIKAMPLRRVLQRAVFVLDKDDTVRYVEYVPEITQQPNYDAALEVAKSLAGK